MSLLDDSPGPSARTQEAEPQVAASPQQDPTTQPHARHEELLKEAMQWIRELETVRDGLYMLSVRNAILLDSLAMAGASEQAMSEDEREDELEHEDDE